MGGMDAMGAAFALARLLRRLPGRRVIGAGSATPHPGSAAFWADQRVARPQVFRAAEAPMMIRVGGAPR